MNSLHRLVDWNISISDIAVMFEQHLKIIKLSCETSTILIPFYYKCTDLYHS